MIRIEEPVHGAVLNQRHGHKSDAGLRIAVRGEAPLGDRVTVNGAPARCAGTRFDADVVLADHETDILAAADGVAGRSEHRVRVVWDRDSRPRYRFSVDDNSFFIRDIGQKKYPSLFDCFYLRILRDLNRKYGAKFSLNLFYTTPENDFTLSQFPDDYKSEWADNAGWLKLSFHAYAEFPDRPYQYARAETLAKDYDLVAGEIHRFAGAQSWAEPTVIHWGMVHPRAMPALAQRGVKVLSGFFYRNSGSAYTTEGDPPPAAHSSTLRAALSTVEWAATHGYDVNYLLDDARSEYLSRHDALKDFETGFVFSMVDIVCNNTPVEKVAPKLEPLTRDPNRAEIMDLFTHEQYFWPFYRNHRPDHAQRCEAAIRFCTERGYQPVFFHEGFLGT